MLSLLEIFVIIFVHWVADFVFQTDKQAKGKSKNLTDLLDHTMNYSMCWFIPIILLLTSSLDDKQTVLSAFTFVGITFMAHTITDYFTSRLNTKLWEKGKVHDFFVSVGFDQCLHYVQLFLTYTYLKNDGILF